MPTIHDVAKHSGVSVTTVSRVINNSPHRVNLKTRERVLESVKALNFIPNPLARALVGEKTRLIGVILGDATDPYFANIVHGISDETQKMGYLTIICQTNRVPEIELSFLHLLREYSADGIIFAGGGLLSPGYLAKAKEIVAWFQRNHVPVVALGNQFLNVLQVSIDDALATREMTEYLLDLGHTRIGFISGPAHVSTSQLRLDGYQDALRRRGIAYDPSLVVVGDFDYAGGRQAAGYYLSLPANPTAIFAANDRLALGCLFELNQLGIKVPEQISLAGFDDIETTGFVYPSLTTVQVPMRTIGEMGVKQLLRAMDERETVEPLLILPHSLVIRRSTAPPAL